MSASSKYEFSLQIAGIFVSALLLASCSTVASPGSDATSSKSANAVSSPETDDEMTAMRDECNAKHEAMKAKMAEDGMMSKDGMKPKEGHMAMSEEMKAKHKKCMEAMPELKEEMQARCKEMKMEAASDGMMMKHGMHKRCKMMADEASTGDDAGEEK